MPSSCFLCPPNLESEAFAKSTIKSTLTSSNKGTLIKPKPLISKALGRVGGLLIIKLSYFDRKFALSSQISLAPPTIRDNAKVDFPDPDSPIIKMPLSPTHTPVAWIVFVRSSKCAPPCKQISQKNDLYLFDIQILVRINNKVINATFKRIVPIQKYKFYQL